MPPNLCSAPGIPVLNSEIRGQLNRLRKLRNEIVHDGAPRKEVEPNQAAELICAAVFGFYYARFGENRLWPAQQKDE